MDDRKVKAQFILTGSANPNDDFKLHIGAGRFTIIEMDTMALQELGYSSGRVSVSNLLEGNEMNHLFENSVSLDFLIERMIIGGWPALIDTYIDVAILLNKAYVDLLCEVDMGRISGVKRDPIKVMSLLKSLTRNTATIVENKTLELDLKTNDKNEISRNTISEYLDALRRLMILNEQPAFNLHIRSAASLRKSLKRHLCDTSLAVAALGLNKEALLKNMNFTGFLFESLAIHDLNVYAKANDATVFYYNDSYGLEIDAVMQKRNGNYALFEIKLGTGFIEQAAENLKKLQDNVDQTKMNLPRFLNIITGTSMSYRRPDGINVISLSSMGK